jgi:hypothetical protein
MQGSSSTNYLIGFYSILLQLVALFFSSTYFNQMFAPRTSSFGTKSNKIAVKTVQNDSILVGLLGYQRPAISGQRV